MKRKQTGHISKQQWDEWLSDADPSPEAQAEMQARIQAGGQLPDPRTEAQTPPEPAEPIVPAEKVVNVSLKVTLPTVPEALKRRWQQLKQLKVRLPHPQKNLRWIGGGAVVIILVLGAGWALFRPQATKDVPAVKGASTEASLATTISFKPALPIDHPDQATAQVYYPKAGVICYPDRISNVAIKVCQQDIPEAYKSDPDNGLKKIASDFGATTIIHESDPNAYFGQSVKGPEYTIFLKNNHLVFINAPEAIEKNDWALYITRLR